MRKNKKKQKTIEQIINRKTLFQNPSLGLVFKQCLLLAGLSRNDFSWKLMRDNILERGTIVWMGGGVNPPF